MSEQQSPNGLFYLCIPDGALSGVKTIAQFHNCSMVDAIELAIINEFKRIDALKNEQRCEGLAKP